MNKLCIDYFTSYRIKTIDKEFDIIYFDFTYRVSKIHIYRNLRRVIISLILKAFETDGGTPLEFCFENFKHDINKKSLIILDSGIKRLIYNIFYKYDKTYCIRYNKIARDKNLERRRNDK